MENLLKAQLINESRLDQEYYFQSLFQEACRIKLLSDSEIERIQMELVDLMGKEVERYTNDESSSIPVEKAQEILQSIVYIIGYFIKTTTDMTQKISILKTEKISEFFHKGMEAISISKTKAEGLLRDLQKGCLKLDNYPYKDTIFTGLPEFFHNYNIEFAANEIPGSFDYPLFTAVTGLTGIEYIEEYLNRFTAEDSFLRHFPDDTINRLLKNFDRESEHILVNIFELTLINALGCSMLGQKVSELKILEEDLSWLQNNLEKLSKDELAHKLEETLFEIKQEMSLEPGLLTYLEDKTLLIAGRITINLQTKTLAKIFITTGNVPSEEVIYEATEPMEDEKLRTLMAQLRACRSTSEKIALIKQNVNSMADFTELIEECFYDEEQDEVFQSLSENERSVLFKILKLEAGLEFDENYEPQKLWQKKFLQSWQ